MLTTLITFVDPNLIPPLVDVAVPAHVDKQAACHILDCPEVCSGQGHHYDKSEDLFMDHRIQEEEAEYSQSFERQMEQACYWIECCREKRVY